MVIAVKIATFRRTLGSYFAYWVFGFLIKINIYPTVKLNMQETPE
jgi:hypothetical protein